MLSPLSDMIGKSHRQLLSEITHSVMDNRLHSAASAINLYPPAALQEPGLLRSHRRCWNDGKIETFLPEMPLFTKIQLLSTSLL